ncbi:hypothetical protein PAXRUDRAFT_11511 [Paxillus rubicundulus Ve08.2h10]|uniref:Uncharacterized protein n=1 Tax=Paxillus rubicundulus Ve08.2h10 TaxID=930991 RepID=A0A0D0DDH4_9AGAM|nr:hypothetical protein PAXRUDRAFT_11511 [Paxillus rubicundulus Ve08.2h10]
MSIRRKSTTHDLATLRLHPDGSRVQQSSRNTRYRTAGSTFVDSRGNWIARDAAGQSSVKKRNASMLSDDGEGEHIRLSSDEESGKRTQSKGKGKQAALDGEPLDEDPEREPEQLSARTKRRLSFTRDYSFLDPPPVSVSSLEQDAYDSDASSSSSLPMISFPDPAPELLKCIHHFASCHYREMGQLFDSSRNYRGEKKERGKRAQDNIHVLAANASRRQNTDSEDGYLIHEEEEDTEEAEDEDDDMGVDDGSREGHRTDSCRKDMYKALGGSALMAIGLLYN